MHEIFLWGKPDYSTGCSPQPMTSHVDIEPRPPKTIEKTKSVRLPQLVVKPQHHETDAEWIERPWRTTLLPNGTIEQCSQLLDGDSDRWIWQYPQVPQDWTPPRGFNLNCDHWLIPLSFCKETREISKGPSTWTISEPMVFTKPQSPAKTRLLNRVR